MDVQNRSSESVRKQTCMDKFVDVMYLFWRIVKKDPFSVMLGLDDILAFHFSCLSTL